METKNAQSFGRLGHNEISLILDLVDGKDLFHLYLSGAPSSISLILKCAHRFDLSYCEWLMKAPNRFISLFPSLKHFSLAARKMQSELYNCIPDLWLDMLPTTLETLKLDFPNALSSFLRISPSDTDIDGSLTFEMIDLNVLLPSLRVLELNTLAILHYSIKLHPSRFPKSLTSLDLCISARWDSCHFYTHELQELPSSLTHLRATIFGPIPTDSELTPNFLFPASLTSLKLTVEGADFLRLLSKEVLELNIWFKNGTGEATHPFPPRLTHLSVYFMLLTVNVAKLLPSTLTYLYWPQFTAVEPDVLNFLPPHLTSIMVNWPRQAQDGQFPSLPSSVTSAQGLYVRDPKSLMNSSTPPAFITALTFSEETMPTSPNSNNEVQEGHFYSSLLTSMAPNLRMISYSTSIHPEFIHMPLALLTLNISKSSLPHNDWMKFCPSLTSLTFPTMNLQEFSNAPFVLRYLNVNLQVDASLHQTAFNWASTPATSRLLSLVIIPRFSPDIYCDSRLFSSVDPGSIPFKMADLMRNLPPNLTYLQVTRDPIGTNPQDTDFIIPTSVFRSLPQSLSNLTLTPIAVEPPHFSILDFKFLPRSMVGRLSLHGPYTAEQRELSTLYSSPPARYDINDYDNAPFYRIPAGIIASQCPKRLDFLDLPVQFQTDLVMPAFSEHMPMMTRFGWNIIRLSSVVSCPPSKFSNELLLSPLLPSETNKGSK